KPLACSQISSENRCIISFSSALETHALCASAPRVDGISARILCKNVRTTDARRPPPLDRARSASLIAYTLSPTSPLLGRICQFAERPEILNLRNVKPSNKSGINACAEICSSPQNSPIVSPHFLPTPTEPSACLSIDADASKTPSLEIT